MDASSRIEAPPGGWIEPYAGLAYKPRQMAVEAATEHRALRLCGIDPDVFGDAVDPSTFISYAIQEGVRNGVHANGTVNMAQRLVQRDKLRLGERLTVTGTIHTVEEVPRGKVAVSETWFAGADGRPGVMSGRRSLRPDPAKVEVRGAGTRIAPIVDNPLALRVLGEVALTPANVVAYDSEGVNPIHSDPDAARRAGFRAPIIGGGMGVRFLTAAIWRRFAPVGIELDIQFRRPIFWDDSLEIRVDERDGEWRAICLVKDGKVATEAAIAGLTLGARA